MCGRYHFGISDSKKGKEIKAKTRKADLAYKTGEIFPTDKVLCVIRSGPALRLNVKKWGVRSDLLQINARIETIEQGEHYDDSYERCVVICDGFYEWDKEKNKYLVTFDDEYRYLACLFNKKDELLIITKEANESLGKIHERMPLIMDEEEMKRYLSGLDHSTREDGLNVERMGDELPLF